MSTRVFYKDASIVTVGTFDNIILKTAGKYLEDDITLHSTISLQSKVVEPLVNGLSVQPDEGYDGLESVIIEQIPSGTATPAATISGTAATVSTGTNTITLTKSISNTPTVSAGYITAGTAGNSSVSLTANVTTKAAATITPTTTNQTIAAGTYLTGIQTIAGDADLIPANIKSGVTIFGVTGTMSSQTYVNGDNLAYGGE